MSSSTTTDSAELQNLIQRFQNYNKPHLLPHFPAKSSAVLVCLYQEQREDKDELRVILTKRSSTLSSHPGEVALPGGKRDEEDSDDIATALREAREEIGLDPSLVTIISVLEPFVNKKGMSVVPVIGFLLDKKAFRPIPNPAEVEEIFDVPLEMFLKDKNRRAEKREYEGHKYLLQYFDYYSEDKEISFIIWALTAGILIRVASIVYQRLPEFQERKPRFWNQPN
ncbi:PREDICTED: nudix hydrolase 11 [Camelina sativa]|uniref:Nudix hydrolase 11 n=1 Tax=Camelina sativa TaxID=90675 RepID=A0ABM0UII7_CAMSA|nr:PREDICTED: nudix hydrolase 11 [Camelina sativa]XP_010441652.1 PREDICTED: nudix hydrolase 11 [Camelina sativa]